MVLASGLNVTFVFYEDPTPLCSVWKQLRNQDMLILCPQNMETKQATHQLGPTRVISSVTRDYEKQIPKNVPELLVYGSSDQDLYCFRGRHIIHKHLH